MLFEIAIKIAAKKHYKWILSGIRFPCELKYN